MKKLSKRVLGSVLSLTLILTISLPISANNVSQQNSKVFSEAEIKAIAQQFTDSQYVELNKDLAAMLPLSEYSQSGIHFGDAVIVV